MHIMNRPGLRVAITFTTLIFMIFATLPHVTISAISISTPTVIPTMFPQAHGVPVAHTIHGQDVVFVPAGCFLMGSAQGEADEQPVHDVCLSAFWIGRTEITNAAYAACVETGVCSPPHDSTYLDNPAYADHPVVFVDWDQASTYAQWVGCQLPTEAQWEYAARGPDSLRFPWGNAFEARRLNHCDAACGYEWRASAYDDGYSASAPVGQFPQGMSWIGTLDMLGNVWEWVGDWYTTDYYAQTPDSALDPTGPDTGWGRVVRGGSWASHQRYTRAASRDWDSPHLRFLVVGFRIACAGNITSNELEDPSPIH